jgi:hypothetical protein
MVSDTPILYKSDVPGIGFVSHDRLQPYLPGRVNWVRLAHFLHIRRPRGTIPSGVARIGFVSHLSHVGDLAPPKAGRIGFVSRLSALEARVVP